MCTGRDGNSVGRGAWTKGDQHNRTRSGHQGHEMVGGEKGRLLSWHHLHCQQGQKHKSVERR